MQEISKDGAKNYQAGPWRTKEELEKMISRSQTLETQVQSIQEMRNVFKEILSSDGVRKNKKSYQETKEIVATADRALKSIEEIRSSVTSETKP